MPFLTQINKLHFTVKPGFKTLSMQAQAQAQQFVFHRESGLDTGMSTSANTRIKIFPFLSCTCAYACVCAATSENEIPLRHNTSTRIFTTHGYVWKMKTLNPDYLAPKQFGRFG